MTDATETTKTQSYCIVVPHYRHVAQLQRFLPALSSANLPLLIVDDGSGADAVAGLRELLRTYPAAKLIERPTNEGKGAATITGLQSAAKLGYSHIILVDADGQHDPADIVHICAASMRQPAAVFSGNPSFGSDIPAARLYGREITNVLARIEAGNFSLQDAMCGLRVYPVAATLLLAQQCGQRTRMEMDTELLVRACWANIEVRYLDTRVVYPEQGASHFRMGQDNVRMVLMHVRLLLTALVRVPLLMLQSAGKQKNRRQDKNRR